MIYPEKFLLIYESEIKTFQDKQKRNGFITSQHVLQMEFQDALQLQPER